MSAAPSTIDPPPKSQTETGPKRVKWASKPRAEHVEQDPLQVADGDDNDDAPRSLDENAQDPAALEQLRRALESYQQPHNEENSPFLPKPPRLQDDGEDVETDVADQRHWQSRARDIVRSHSRGRRDVTRISEAHGRTRLRGGYHSLRRHKSVSKVEEEKREEKEKDLEANLHQSPNIAPLPLGPGRGVLSTLLTLYDTKNRSGSGSATSSPSTSRASSPTSSRASSPSPEIEIEISSSGGPHPLPAVSETPESAETDLPATGASSEKNHVFGIPLPSPPARLEDLIPTPTSHPRPKAARNAGGVFGTLIATSHNLSGPAAPIPSTIAPNVARPGWRLNRYALLPEVKVKRRVHSAPSTPLLGSGDDYFSIAPGSASPTHPDAHKPKRSAWDWISHPHLSTRNVTGSRQSSIVKGDTSPTKVELDVGDENFGLASGNGKAYRRVRKERRRKAEIFITKHIAEIMQRQEFLVKLSRALMMFAAPTHRLQAQLQATSRVLDLEISTFYLPGVLLISFGDDATGTSNIKFIQQTSNLDLGKLLDTHRLYWKVTHDEISVSSASALLDFLMRMPPQYSGWRVVLFGGLCSGAICSLSFSGSFIDSLMAVPLGALLVLVQIFSGRNELYSHVFEITIATLLSFISAGLASTKYFCYAALASSSVVLILPGFIVLCGSLELASRQIVSGAVRVCFAVIYSLFLGFGLAMGADVYSRITGLPVVGPDDSTCATSHRMDGPWWQQPVSIWWAFLCVPVYSLALSLRNQAPLLRKELPITVLISCGGWAANHFAGIVFVKRPDIQSALGAFAVGIVANVYARFFSGNAYVVMITGILFQLPSGLANGGLLTFAAVDTQGQQFQSYQAGFQVALQLVAVAIGLTVGLFTSVVVVHPLGGSRRQAAGLFSL